MTISKELQERMSAILEKEVVNPHDLMMEAFEKMTGDGREHLVNNIVRMQKGGHKPVNMSLKFEHEGGETIIKGRAYMPNVDEEGPNASGNDPKLGKDPSKKPKVKE